jgi:hypothetical protein
MLNFTVGAVLGSNNFVLLVIGTMTLENQIFDGRAFEKCPIYFCELDHLANGLFINAVRNRGRGGGWLMLQATDSLANDFVDRLKLSGIERPLLPQFVPVRE